MTQEQKDLLLKDLCARLSYRVKVQIKNEIDVLDSICNDDGYYFNFICEDREGVNIEQIKPYLFPLSSMTEEQKKEYKQFLEDIDGYAYSIDCVPQIDWLNAHHFDFRGLISKGLALDATNLNIY